MSELADVRIAIVGPGAIGDVHANSLAAVGFGVRAVVGPIEAEREEFAAKHGVPERYPDLDALLAGDNVDAAIVATPSHLHAAQTEALLDAGKHVLCEIPAGLNVAAAASIADRAKSAGRVAMVGHTLRYWEPHRRLQAALADLDVVPSQVVVRSLMLRQTNVGWTGRVRDWTDSVLWHHGGHAMDATFWHLRDPGPVTVEGRPGPVWQHTGDVMDVSAVLTTADRRLALIALSYHSRIAVSDFLVIAPDHTLLVTEGRLLIDGDVAYDAGSVAAAQAAAMQAQDLDFLRGAAGLGTPDVTVADVLPAMHALQTLAARA